MTITRLNPEIRKQRILLAAIEMADRSNYLTLQREDVAIKAGVSVSLVTAYFKDMPSLRQEVLKAAVDRELPRIVLQGLCAKDPIALHAPEALKELAKTFL